MDEREILAEVKEGNATAFERLYDRYWLKVYNFTRLYITSSTEVSEVVQDVFVKVWESRETFDDTKNFDGFLFIITRNIIFNQKRRSFNEDFYKSSVLDAYTEDNINDACEAEEKMYALELSRFIDALVQSLPERQRDCFLLSRVEKMTYREIGERLGISERTVEVHIMRALKCLKKNIILFLIFLAQ